MTSPPMSSQIAVESHTRVVAKTDSAARLRHLDGLRGVAILLVLIVHFVVPLFNHTPGSPGAYMSVALGLGYTGVDLFFVLSGYLVGGIILDHRGSSGFPAAFYVRRSARILPLAFICVATNLILQHAGLFGPPEGGKPWPTAVYLTFSTNLWMSGAADWGYRPLSPLWSLAIEEQFYLFAPWLLRAIPPAWIGRTIFGLIAGATLSRAAMLAYGIAPLGIAFLPFARMDSIGFGLLVAWIVRSPPATHWCKANQKWIILLYTLLAAGCVLLIKLRAGNAGHAMVAWGYTVVAGFYGLSLLWLELNLFAIPRQVLGATPLVLLGRYSYFLYLFQGLILGLAVSLVFTGQTPIRPPQKWIELGFGFVVLLLVAAASFRWLEQPILALGRRWRYSPTAKAT
jgi:peptidoglycan/LPS O-acetylase OafA/YrhL